MVHLNLLKDCPITNADIANAHTIFGPNLANIRGKVVCWKPERITTDYVEIPQSIIENNKWVSLVAVIMFVNGIPFLVSASHNINLITIEHAPTCTTPKLDYLLERALLRFMPGLVSMSKRRLA